LRCSFLKKKGKHANPQTGELVLKKKKRRGEKNRPHPLNPTPGRWIPTNGQGEKKKKSGEFSYFLFAKKRNFSFGKRGRGKGEGLRKNTPRCRRKEKGGGGDTSALSIALTRGEKRGEAKTPRT